MDYLKYIHCRCFMVELMKGSTNVITILMNKYDKDKYYICYIPEEQVGYVYNTSKCHSIFCKNYD